VVIAGKLRRQLGGLIAAAALTVAGCSLSGPLATPSEPFSDFTVGEFGGIDGRQNIVHLRADGVALLVSRVPAAGRLSDQKLSRLRILLTSEEFGKEVANEAQRTPPTTEQVCSDLITHEVTMGNLSMSRTEPCGEESRPAPAFDEIVSIVAPATRGNFDGPVESAEPRLFPVRLERIELQDQAGYVIKVGAAGRGTITGAGGGSKQRDLSVQQRDTLRLLIARVIEEPIVPCTTTAHYRLHIDTEPAISGPDCGFQERQPEFGALTVLLEDAFDL
jgi:hypothetical protein